MKKYWITGVSGTGKTTVGIALAKRGFYVIDIEEVEGLCGWYGRETGHLVDFPAIVTAEFSNEHKWRLNLEKLDQLLGTTSSPVIIVGMNDVLKENMNMFEKVFILRCDPDVFIDRLNARDNNQFGKEDSIQQSILSFYARHEAAMMDAGAISINSNLSVKEVTEQITSNI
jgi:broad-specificity NMP kinase